MIRVSAKVVGAAALAARFEQRGARASGAVMVALEESATIVSSEAQRLILDGPKTGRIYEKYNPRRTHQASAPGQAPANDLGWLASNIVVDRADLISGRISVAALAAYAKFLEFGTARIKPRPFLRRALQTCRVAVQRAFVAALNRQGLR